MERVSTENSGATSATSATNKKAWFEDVSSSNGGRNSNVNGSSNDATSSNDIQTDDLNVSEIGVASNGRVYIEIEHLDHDILKATVKCEEIETPVLGLAFHLEYQKDLLHFLRYDPGNFLEQGGDPFYIVSDNSGAVIFGETLRRDDSFPFGGGNVVSIYFQKDSSYNEKSIIELNFKNGVVSGMDSTRQDIDQINFENFSSAEVAKRENEITSDDKIESVLTTNVFAGGFQHYILGVLSTFGIVFLVLASVIFIKHIKASRKI